jgi:NTE family protein/lysophospholipid hydrolase
MPANVDIELLLKSTYLFRSLDEEVIQDLSEGVELVDVEQGLILIRQGEPGDCLYIVVDGYLQATTQQPDAEKKRILCTMGPGDPAGEMALSGEARRTADVHALSNATLLRIRTSSFVRAAERAPVLLHRLGDIIRQRLRRTRLAEILPSVFGTLDETKIATLEAELEWVHLPRGSVLFNQGETGDALYLLVSGRLQALVEEPAKQFRFVGEISPGEPVGEMALFTGEPRSATIRAMRDSLLVRFTRSAFDRLMSQNPELTRSVTQTIIERLRRTIRSPVSAASVTNIAIVYVNSGSRITGFAERLESVLSRYGSVRHLTPEVVDRSLGCTGAAQSGETDPFALKLSAWLDEQEATYQYLLYEAEAEVTTWTKRCIRQADLLLLVARADASPELSAIERAVIDIDIDGARVVQDLILVHDDPLLPARGTHQWLSGRRIRNHYHVRWTEQGDFQRLARILSGNAVGLVLGGGGARGFAHVGVLKALTEYDIPIDMIGGTSIGAIIAALIAMGWEAERMQTGLWQSFVVDRPFKDYTLPLFSLLKDRKFRRMAARACNDTRIEDLWVNFFCVSSCLSSAEMIVHRTGHLHQAIRASSALPGITTPVVIDGRLLVDGAVLNNLPGDVMRTLCHGSVIVVDVGSAEELLVDFEVFPSPWAHLLNRLLPFRKPKRVPTVLEFLTQSTMLSSKQRAREAKAAADVYLRPPIDEFGLLDFAELERIVEAGYRHTVERIDEIKAVCTPR